MESVSQDKEEPIDLEIPAQNPTPTDKDEATDGKIEKESDAEKTERLSQMDQERREPLGEDLAPPQEETESESGEEDQDPQKNFPEYANELNKQLNQNIIKLKKQAQILDKKIEDYSERYQIMEQHYKNIIQEVKNTQQLAQEKHQEIEQEKHFSLILERQIGKLFKNQKQKEGYINQLREKLNEIQKKIFSGNQRLEKLKMEINWNQEEKEMWQLAVKQKEEDKIFIERHQRTDDLKIKELTIDIEKLTTEKNKLESELKTEVTETQALQIEIEKISQEYKIQNEERTKLFQHWDTLIQKIAEKNRLLVEQGNKMVTSKNKTQESAEIIKEKLRQINKIKRICNHYNKEIKRLEKIIYQKKTENKTLELNHKNLKADMKITQNRLSAFSSKFEKEKNILTVLENELIGKKKRLALVEQNYQKQITLLDHEVKTDFSLKEVTKSNEELMQEKMKKTQEIDRKI